MMDQLTLGLHEQILFDELVLLQDFHGVGDACVLLSDQVHFSKGTSTDDLQDVEVFFRNLFGGLQQVLGWTVVGIFFLGFLVRLVNVSVILICGGSNISYLSFG